MLLSVIIPVYNEKNLIKEIIKRVKDVKINKEIIIVDDNSNDGTKEILKKIKDKKIKVFFHDKNRGKTGCIKTAFKHVKGDIVVIQDADLEYNPQDYIKLVKPIIDGKTSFVNGTRYPKGGKHPPLTNPYFLADKILTFTINLLYNAHMTDETSCYRVFKTELIKEIELRGDKFHFNPEFAAKALKKGYKILEIPISYKPRTKKQGKKIKWHDGFRALFALIKYRFVD